MPKIVNHEEYRQTLLEKSLNLFTRKGYNNINMKEIAAEIGVSTGTLYHYFPSKGDMLSQMIAWVGDRNIQEYIERTSNVENISDRFDMMVGYWKERSELYEDIMLLAIDMYRTTKMEQWKPVYSFFAERHTAGMSERLNISREFARFIFIYFIGLSFHSLAFDGTDEFHSEVDFLNAILRPLIAEAPLDMDQAAHHFMKIHKELLMKAPTNVPQETEHKEKNGKPGKTNNKEGKAVKKTGTRGGQIDHE